MDNDKLVKLSIEEFVEKLASADPTPGGGGAGALAGALAAALGAMVGEITHASNACGELEEAIREADSYRERLLWCVDEDAAAFMELSHIYSMSRETPGYGSLKEDALRGAAAVPMELLSLLAALTDTLEVFARLGSMSVVSDAACALAICQGAMRAAFASVIANTRLMKDKDVALSLDAEACSILDIYGGKAEALYDSVMRRLSPEAAECGEPLVMRGGEAARSLGALLKERAQSLREAGVVPTLALLRTGSDPADIAYERSIEKAALEIGIELRYFIYSEGEPAETVLMGVREIAADPSIHGCLVLRPMADRELEAAVHIDLGPDKDLDFASPCTAEAVMELLGFYAVETAGRRAVVIGRSRVIGRPVAKMLLDSDATVTICHSRTEDLRHICREADIIVAAAGEAGLIDESYLSPGQILVDVGTSVAEGGQIRGDISEEAYKMASAYTPVPGGVGALTTMILMRHLIDAAEKLTELPTPMGR